MKIFYECLERGGVHHRASCNSFLGEIRLHPDQNILWKIVVLNHELGHMAVVWFGEAFEDAFDLVWDRLARLCFPDIIDEWRREWKRVLQGNSVD